MILEEDISGVLEDVQKTLRVVLLALEKEVPLSLEEVRVVLPEVPEILGEVLLVLKKGRGALFNP